MDYLQHSRTALLCAHTVPSVATAGPAAPRASLLPAPQLSSRVLQPASEPHHIAKENHQGKPGLLLHPPDRSH